ncbi:hypothetical protein GALLR39Z86_08350 [Glycomyces algeriensis]|uniref:Uncharacterized protein n=1 Tax=Glycomyces algeriensis TaxID=256037 RepID=A0A9W6G4P4_9ACTN|nr:hypothetical protein GALLR39Z86_08350 [Glycomyces algeriensis]
MTDAAMPLNRRIENHRDREPIFATTRIRPAIAMPHNNSVGVPSRRPATAAPTGHCRQPVRPATPAATATLALAGVPDAALRPQLLQGTRIPSAPSLTALTATNRATRHHRHDNDPVAGQDPKCGPRDDRAPETRHHRRRSL